MDDEKITSAPNTLLPVAEQTIQTTPHLFSLAAEARSTGPANHAPKTQSGTRQSRRLGHVNFVLAAALIYAKRYQDHFNLHNAG
jgi:hypothetical protein